MFNFLRGLKGSGLTIKGVIPPHNISPLLRDLTREKPHASISGEGSAMFAKVDRLQLHYSALNFVGNQKC